MAAEKPVSYRYLGNHAYEVMQGDKSVPVAPGDFVDLSSDDLKLDHNKTLKSDGLLMKVDTNE